MKENTPVVYWDTCEEVSGVFEEKAKELSCKCDSMSKRDYVILRNENKTIDFLYVYRYDISVILRLNTIARYQVENCVLALKALEVLEGIYGNKINLRKNMKRGVEACFWPGRMEEVLPDIFVDGAHNADGVRAFLETVSEDAFKGKRSLMFSVVSDKDYAQMIGNLAKSGLFSKIYLSQMDNNRATSLEEMKCHLPESYKGEIVLYDSVRKAFKEVREKKQANERVYIVGSLYLVGEIKEYVDDDKF